jgi:c-di-GMP-binding flagellar brake protein YcgR
MMFKERRKFIRVAYFTGVKWKDITGYAKVLGFIPDGSRNISAGGIRMISSIRLKVGQELKLEFPLLGHQLVDIRGEVKWVSRVGKDEEDSSPAYNMGVEFLDIKDEDRDFIDKFVFQSRAG